VPAASPAVGRSAEDGTVARFAPQNAHTTKSAAARENAGAALPVMPTVRVWLAASLRRATLRIRHTRISYSPSAASCPGHSFPPVQPELVPAKRLRVAAIARQSHR
jgi:hypothetical protein